MNEDQTQACTAYIRAYAKPIELRTNKHNPNWNNNRVQEQDNTIDEIICIDTETSMEVDKSLLYGFALHTGREGLKRLIVFYEPEQLSKEEIAILQEYAKLVDLSNIADRLGI